MDSAILLSTVLLLSFPPQTSKASSPPAKKSAAPAKTSAPIVPVRTAAANLLRAALKEKSAVRRAEAVVAYGTIGTQPEVVRRIESSLNDSDEDVRRAAAATLGEMKSRGSIPRLKQALEDKSARVRFVAALSLWQMGDRSGRAILSAVLGGEGGGGVKDTVSSEFRGAKKTLSDPKKVGMMGLKEGAGALLGPFALGITVAQAVTQDRSAPERTLCAVMFGEDRDIASVKQLEAALVDKSWLVRAAAARALGGIGRPASIPKLRALFEDDRPAVRYTAAASVLRLTEPPRPT